MDPDFSMECDYWRLEINTGTFDEVKIHIIFKKGEIPEQEMRKLESHIRLILQGCGRLDINPTKR